MAVAALKPVQHLLDDAGVGVLIVATGQPAQAQKFLAGLGFDLPGALVLDPEKRTHAALGSMGSSVWQSLVTPFLKHTSTFGVAAIWEGLRVSLANIGPNGSHGSSWQQGGTFVFSHDSQGGDVRCDYAWMERYPGDWRPLQEVLKDIGIAGAPPVDLRERLRFVIEQRNKAHGEAPSCFSPLLLATLAGGVSALLWARRQGRLS